MGVVAVMSQSGETVGEADLDEAVFGVELKLGLMHQVVTAQLAARRSGTHHTLGRAEVSGGGRKPWRQKGTGRARHGSIRAPQWRGGGVAHGPKPRDYSQRTPKKMKRLALASALSDRARCGDVVVVDRWDFPEPRTRAAHAALVAIGVADRKVLLVLGDEDDNSQRSFRNLGAVHCLHVRELNTYDVLNSDVVVFTLATLPGHRSEPLVETEVSTGDVVDVVAGVSGGDGAVDVVEGSGDVVDVVAGVSGDDVVDVVAGVSGDGAVDVAEGSGDDAVDVVESDSESGSDQREVSGDA